MSDTTKGAIAFVIFGCMLVGAFFGFTRWKEARKNVLTSDAAEVKTTVRIGGDGYLGYWFMTSAEMKRQAARSGRGVNFVNDNGMYAEREKKFAAKELDMMMLPINSYVEHGLSDNYPGVIIGVVARSNGGDGIVGRADKFPTGKIEELNNAGLKVVYTPDSPSSFLLDLVITDFDLAHLRSSSNWKIEVGGSEEVAKKAVQGHGDVFVMWEPDLSKALHDNPNLKRLWGSDRFSGYIVDVIVVHRDYLESHSEDVHAILEAYFGAMRHYLNNRSAMLSEMVQSTGLTQKRLEEVLPTIDWYDLNENARLGFGLQMSGDGVASEGVVQTITACQTVLTRTGKLKSDPFKGNPYIVVNSSVIKELVKTAPATLGNRGEKMEFSKIEDAEWQRLREIGPLRVEPITFQSGVNLLDDSGKGGVDAIALLLTNNYPQYRVDVRGHTAPGDDEENLRLSLERAEAIKQYLIAVHGLDANRLHARGLGSSQPPQRLPGESTRALQYRMPRVEFVLIEGNTL